MIIVSRHSSHLFPLQCPPLKTLRRRQGKTDSPLREVAESFPFDDDLHAADGHLYPPVLGTAFRRAVVGDVCFSGARPTQVTIASRMRLKDKTEIKRMVLDLPEGQRESYPARSAGYGLRQSNERSERAAIVK